MLLVLLGIGSIKIEGIILIVFDMIFEVVEVVVFVII